MTVYVVHLSNRRLDLTDAARFGPLKICVEGPIISLPFAIETLRSKITTFGPKDFLLAIGSPVLIMAAGLLAEDLSTTGVVNVLQWQPEDRKYVPINFQIWSRTDNDDNHVN